MRCRVLKQFSSRTWRSSPTESTSLSPGAISIAEPVRLKGNVPINCKMWQGDAIPRIRGLEDQRSGMAPRRKVSRVGTEGDRYAEVTRDTSSLDFHRSG